MKAIHKYQNDISINYMLLNQILKVLNYSSFINKLASRSGLKDAIFSTVLLEPRESRLL